MVREIFVLPTAAGRFAHVFSVEAESLLKSKQARAPAAVTCAEKRSKQGG